VKNSMLCLLPSKTAQRGRGVDDPLTSGDQMRRAIFVVLMVVGFIGATASAAAAPWWQIKIQSGMPGKTVPHDLGSVGWGAAGGVCGDFHAEVSNPTICDATHRNRNRINIDLFDVYAAPYSVDQTIRVDASLYQWNFPAYRWVPVSALLYPVYSRQTTVPVFYPSGYQIFGSPFRDLYSGCGYPYDGCWPAFYGIKSDQAYYFTIVVRITWSNFYPPYQVLARADYIPGPPPRRYRPWRHRVRPLRGGRGDGRGAVQA